MIQNWMIYTAIIIAAAIVLVVAWILVAIWNELAARVNIQPGLGSLDGDE